MATAIREIPAIREIHLQRPEWPGSASSPLALGHQVIGGSGKYTGRWFGRQPDAWKSAIAVVGDSPLIGPQWQFSSRMPGSRPGKVGEAMQ